MCWKLHDENHTISVAVASFFSIFFLSAGKHGIPRRKGTSRPSRASGEHFWLFCSLLAAFSSAFAAEHGHLFCFASKLKHDLKKLVLSQPKSIRFLSSRWSENNYIVHFLCSHMLYFYHFSASSFCFFISLSFFLAIPVADYSSEIAKSIEGRFEKLNAKKKGFSLVIR